MPTEHYEPFHVLYHKLLSTSKSLRAWSKNLISDAKNQFRMENEVILRLDIAQETRSLSPTELSLREELKRRVLGLAVLGRVRKKQASRISNLKLGDANTTFFHRKLNARRRKNNIQHIRNGHGWAIQHEEKAEVIQEHFNHVMGRPPPRLHELNWEEHQIPSHDLEGLDAPFTEEELLNAIK